MPLVIGDSAEALAGLLADHFLCRLQAAAFRRRTLRVALSGGHTPQGFYRELARRNAECPWSSMEIFFSDERAVGPDHPDSNYGMAFRTWLQAAPATAVIHRMEGERGAKEAAHAYRRLLPENEPLDLVLLGLGPDGHTASLFPADAGWRTPEPVLAVPAQGNHGARISLGLPTLVAARERWLIAQGADKIPALRDALAGGGHTPAAELMRKAPVTAWIDRALAQGLCP